MAVNTTQVATGGSYIAISSENATLTTALNEVIIELESLGASWNQSQIAICNNGTNYAVAIIVKRH